MKGRHIFQGPDYVHTVTTSQHGALSLWRPLLPAALAITPHAGPLPVLVSHHGEVPTQSGHFPRNLLDHSHSTQTCLYPTIQLVSILDS